MESRNIFLLVIFLSGQSYAARILVFPNPEKSHTFYVNAVAEGLPARGHEVYTVQPEYFDEPKHLTKLGFKVLEYPIPEGGLTFASEEFKAEAMEVMLGLKSIVDIKYAPKVLVGECEYALAENFTQSLKDLKFDMAVIDGMPLAPCLLLIPHILNIPFVYVSSFLPWFPSRVPKLPSFVPSLMLEYSDNMNFIQRLKNFASTIMFESELLHILPITAGMSALFHKHVHDSSITKWNHLASKASLFMNNRGPLLEWPAPSMPNTFHLEGLTARPGKPLPKDLNEIVQNAKFGFVTVSFGSILDRIPSQFREMFLKAFSKRPETFFFRMNLEKDENVDIPANVHVMSWLPQNDLLAHPKAKLFITHCGNNGQYEALYHGVPMIGLPIGGDQHHNAKRLVEHGYGLTANMPTVTSEELLTMIETIVSDTSFKKNIAKASSILRSHHMNARETAAYWIDHVLQFGDKHLRSHAVDMPLYQYLMLDILGFIVTAIILITVVIYILIKKCARLACGKKAATKLKSS